MQIGFSRVYLLSSPLLKIVILEIARRLNLKVIYFDDLPYNHENGEVFFYDTVLAYVAKHQIRHVGYELILKISREKLGHTFEIW